MRKQLEFKKQQKDLQESVRLEATSVEDLCRRCIEVQNKFAEQDGTPKLINMVMDVHYSPNASNSHSSPILGVRNFSGKPELPTGYPALTGRVKFKYERDHNNLKRVGGNMLWFINTGTGGDAEMMGDLYPYVECTECSLSFAGNHQYDSDFESAAEQWNSRV